MYVDGGFWALETDAASFKLQVMVVKIDACVFQGFGFQGFGFGVYTIYSVLASGSAASL